MSAAIVAVPSALPVTAMLIPDATALATAGFCDAASTVSGSQFGSLALIGTFTVSPTVRRCSPTGSTTGASFAAVTVTTKLTATGALTPSDTDSAILVCPAPFATMRIVPTAGISTLATAGFSLIASAVTVSPSGSVAAYGTFTTSPTASD